MYMENQLILEKGAKTTLQRECDMVPFCFLLAIGFT